MCARPASPQPEAQLRYQEQLEEESQLAECLLSGTKLEALLAAREL